jgi:hypothetical protein
MLSFKREYLKGKFRADSESDFIIRSSFELTSLGFCKTHIRAFLPNYVEFLYIKLKKYPKYYFDKTKILIKKIKILVVRNSMLYVILYFKLRNFVISQSGI